MTVSQHPYLEDEEGHWVDGCWVVGPDPRHSVAGFVALLDALDEGHDVETWPEHSGEGPDVSNWGNERQTTGP